MVTGPPGGPGAILVDEELPETLFVFPLRRAVPFPNLMMPILLDSPKSREIIAQVEAGNGYVFLVMQRDPDEEDPGTRSFYSIGVIARVLKVLKLPDGSASAMCQGLRRGKVKKFLRKKPLLLGKVASVVDIPPKGKRAKAAFRKLQDTLHKVVGMSDSLGDEITTAVLNIEQPDQLADFTGSYFLKAPEQRQKVLETLEVGKRVEYALQYVMAELELAELGNRIQEEIRAKAEKAQKEYFLREQLKIIRRELGEETGRARGRDRQRIERGDRGGEMPSHGT